MPLIAAPIAVPTMFDSASGMSITRSWPNSSSSCLVAPNTPPLLATSSPRMMTRGSRAISCCSVVRTDSTSVITAMTSRGLVLDVTHHRRGIGQRRAFGAGGCVVHFALAAAAGLGHQAVVERTRLHQALPEAHDRVAFLPALRLLTRAVHAVVVVARVGHEAVDLPLQKRRPLPSPRARYGSFHRLVYRQHVHAIQRLARHRVARGALG